MLRRPARPPDFTVAYGDHADQIADVRLPPNMGRESETASPLRGPAQSGVPAVKPSSSMVTAPAQPPAPLVLFLHGGFWRAEYDRAHVGPLAQALSAAGFVVATVEYRRTGAPGGGWPGTFDDVSRALRLAPRLIAQKVPVDTSHLIIGGHSAGGHLALWGAVQLRWAQAARDPSAPEFASVRVVALAPVADLAEAHRLDLDEGAVTALLGGGPAEVPDRFATADPMRLLPLGVLVTVLHGDADIQVPIGLSRGFVAAARAAGDLVAYHELAHTDHFALIDPESTAWASVLNAFDTSPGEPVALS